MPGSVSCLVFISRFIVAVVSFQQIVTGVQKVTKMRGQNSTSKGKVKYLFPRFETQPSVFLHFPPWC